MYLKNYNTRLNTISLVNFLKDEHKLPLFYTSCPVHFLTFYLKFFVRCTAIKVMVEKFEIDAKSQETKLQEKKEIKEKRHKTFKTVIAKQLIIIII